MFCTKPLENCSRLERNNACEEFYSRRKFNAFCFSRQTSFYLNTFLLFMKACGPCFTCFFFFFFHSSNFRTARYPAISNCWLHIRRNFKSMPRFKTNSPFSPNLLLSSGPLSQLICTQNLPISSKTLAKFRQIPVIFAKWLD